MSGSAQQTIRFELDGVEVDAYAGETIWQAAKRHATDIPHLCYADEPGYREDRRRHSRFEQNRKGDVVIVLKPIIKGNRQRGLVDVTAAQS